MKIKLFTTILLFTSSIAFAEIAVVVHSSNSGPINANEISRLFLGKMKSFPTGATAVPIIQNAKSAITLEFNKKVLKKSSSQLKAYWAKLLFTGKGSPPKVIDSDAKIIELIKNNPNMIGYIDSTNVTGDVIVVAKF